MAQPPPTNPNDWVAVTGAIAGIIAGLGGLFAGVASYVKLGARVEGLEANKARTVKRLDEVDKDIESLKLNDAKGSAKREIMHALLEENRRDIKQILAAVAQLAAANTQNNNRENK